MLSAEVTADKVVWSLGEYVADADLGRVLAPGRAASGDGIVRQPAVALHGNNAKDLGDRPELLLAVVVSMRCI